MAHRQLVNGIRVYSRHSADCKYTDTAHVACNCPKWLQYQVNGKPKKESAGTRSFTQAKKAAEQKDKELRGDVLIKPSTITVDQAVKDWLEFRTKNKKGKGKDEKPELLGRKLVEWTKANGITFLHQITTSHTTKFRNSLPYRTGDSSSLKIHWSVIKGFFSWCKGEKLITENPIPNTRESPQHRIDFKKKEVAVPTAKEVEKAIAAVDKVAWVAQRKHRVRLFMLTQRWSAMAIRDTATLGREKLGEDNRIRSNRTKTNERFKIRIPAWLATELKGLPCNDPDFFFWHLGFDGRKSKPTSIVSFWEEELRKVFKLAGVKMTPHSFRHFRITELLEVEGWGVDDVAKMVGTSPTEIRKTYHHWIKENDDVMDAKQSEIWIKQGLDANGNPRAATIL